MKILLIAFFATFTLAAKCQKADDILRKGIAVKDHEILIFNFDPSAKVLKYDIIRSLQDASKPVDYITIDDTLYLLPKRNAINAYIKPLNPLNFSSKGENQIVVDPIDEEAAKSFSAMLDLLKPAIEGKAKPGKGAPSPKGSKKPAAVPAPTPDTCDAFIAIQKKFRDINDSLSVDQQPKIVKLFKQLQALDFAERENTEKKLADISAEKKETETHFKAIDNELTKLKSLIAAYNCTTPGGSLTTWVLTSMLKDLTAVNEAQKKRLTNLQSAYDLVSSVRDAAVKGGGAPGVQWCIPLDEIPAKEGKLSKFSLSVKQSGYTLSDKNEIVPSDTKDILKKTVVFRHFQRFIPEVSAGFIYTFFKYKQYGTTTDASGQQTVGAPTEKPVKNFKVAGMLNLVYYTPNSNVQPLLQLGVGVNSDIPTLLAGGGLRFRIGTRGLVLSYGAAMTWIKTLDQLKVGDKVSGTTAIDKDLKYEFSWPPKTYVGLQYNF